MLKQFTYLVALAREQHFGRAAESCNVSQPTLSAAIRQLEEEMGAPIVERGYRFNGLTAEGQVVLEHAKRVLAECAMMRQSLDEMGEGLSGRLRIGVVPTALPVISLLTVPFYQRFPKVTITVLSQNSNEIEKGIVDFEIDAGLTYLDNEPLSHLRSKPVYTEDYFFLTRTTEQNAHLTQISWSEAAEQPLCLLTPDMQNRRIIDGIFRSVGKSPKPAMETNSIFNLCSHAAAGYWSSIVPEQLLHFFGLPEGTKALALTEPHVSRTVGLIVSDREPLSPLARSLFSMVGPLNIAKMLKPPITSECLMQAKMLHAVEVKRPFDEIQAQAIITNLADEPGAMLPILHALQEAFGFVDARAVPMIAESLNVSKAEVHGVITFYHDFRHAPAGRHILKICRAEACQSMGVETLVAHVERALGLKMGETSDDMQLTIENVYCLGNCALSPAALFDGELIGRIDADQLDQLMSVARTGAIQTEADARKIDVQIIRTGSRGLLWLEPLVEAETASGRIGFGPVKPADVKGLFDIGFVGEHALRLGEVEDMPVFKLQQRFTFERVGRTDPLSMVDFHAHGGGVGLRKAKAYADVGMGRSRGTIPVQLAGNIKHGGLYELAFGISLRELIYDIGGGTVSGRPVKAVQVGGPLGAYFSEKQLDIHLDYEAMLAAKGMLGHGGVVVFDDTVNLAAQARFAMHFCAIESCGKCTPCRIGSTRGVETIDKIVAGIEPAKNTALLNDLSP
eukprot:gene13418-13532_t